MGLTYVFALVVGLGILTVQSVMGSKDADADADHDAGFHADGDADFDADADADFGADADADLDADADFDADADVHAGGGGHAGHDHAGHDHLGQVGSGVGSFVALFLSVRFWVFASLGFGLGGTLLHYFTSVAASATLVSAISLGLITGLMAAMAFRALRRTSGQRIGSTTSAVGKTGRLLLPISADTRGKVRIQLSGQMVDLIASTDGEEIKRGDTVVIEEVEGDVAIVSRAPDELQ